MPKIEKIYGLHAVQSLLETAPHRVREIHYVKGRQDKRMRTVLGMATDQGVLCREQTRQFLDALCDGQHQGVIAIAQSMRNLSEKDLPKLIENCQNEPLILILDGVTDPHNLGACLRTADAAGANALIVPKDNSAGLNETVRKVACGAAETVPLIEVTNLVRTMKKLQTLGLWIVGTAGEATGSLYDLDLRGPRAVVLGAEGKGMRRLTREHCDQLISIPMYGAVSSLNVSVATGITLFEIIRQRGMDK